GLAEHQLPVPRAIPGNHVPGGVFRRGLGDHRCVGCLEVVPLLPGVEIPEVEFPVLFRIVEAGLEALGLLFLRDVDEELDYVGALLEQQTLEVADVLIPTSPRSEERRVGEAECAPASAESEVAAR